MSGIIDFHTHILPCIDDGSRSLEASIAMLQAEAAQGIQRVVATPHFYAHSDSPDRFLARRAEAEAALREEMAKYDNLPQVDMGAEVYYFQGISHSDAISGLTTAGKSSILIELPAAPWPAQIYNELERLYSWFGLTPIIAHLDRYISPFHTHGIPKRLAELPVLVQVNASFFLRRATRRMALRMLKEGRIHLIGSDCHNLSNRAPNLGEAIQIIQQAKAADALAQIYAAQDSILVPTH